VNDDYDRKSRAGSRLQCPQCAGREVQTQRIRHVFQYGQEPEAVQLSAVVPLRRCARCGFEFLDAAAEEAQHEAICRHLGVMTPAEIRELRRRYGLSRKQFAAITKLGAATVARWERGELIQNAAYDQFLYLLTFAENLQRLRDRNKPAPRADCPADRNEEPPRFRLINPTDDERAARRSFLRKTA